MAEVEAQAPVQTEETEPTAEPPTTEEAAGEPEIEEEYVCPPEFDEREDMCKMFVGGIDKDTTDEEFKELFTSYGEVKDFIIIKKDNVKSDRRFGFITFTKCDDLEECLLQRPHKYKDAELDVSRAVPRVANKGGAEIEHSKVKKLHVANIPKEGLEEKSLEKYLLSRHPKKYGLIEEVKFVKDDKEQNRGFGFIKVSTEDFADRIAIAETKFVLDGHNLKINKAKPRAGGGSGGGRGRGGMHGNNQYGGGWNEWQNYGGQPDPYYGGYGGYGYQGYQGGGYGGYGGYGGGYGSYGPPRGGRGGRYKPY